MSKEIVVGNYNTNFNSILGCNYPDYEIYRSKGLIAHLLKRHHDKVIDENNNSLYNNSTEKE